ncbi:MAG: carbohydrate ABC transporter permease [Candidatus Goldbacteria bacterium]|nr:carbohydrate ABC transporter permease [Candidatus Goldiibacteriota bacterium]
MDETKKISFWESKKKQNFIISGILYVIAWAGALIFVVPLVWMIVTSLKTPEEIFTIPPKWIPISTITLNYDLNIKSQRDGIAEFSKRDDGTRIITIDNFHHVIPESATVLVKKRTKITKGQVIATMPKQGIVKIIEHDDKTKILQVVDENGALIKQYQLPENIKLFVKDGDIVKPGTKLVRINPQWQNYVKAWAPEALDETFNRYLLNTIIITVFGITGVLLSSTIVAYAFARFRFPGRDVLFLIMISTMMIPVQVTMIPTFILFKYLGWIDTFAPLIVPTYFGGGAFNIFLMRQFFMTIPYELDDAAKIDGCNYFQIFSIILLPLVKPALATVAIFGFVYNWNDFLNPLIYLNSTSNYTLALGLQTFTTMYGTDYNLMMAASTIVLLPILIVFFFGQRYFIEGVATSGLKG